jgi:DNA-directed RNA polymerase subunit RPC12/RpoP
VRRAAASTGDHLAFVAGDSMWPGQESPFDQRKPLVHCPRCASRLIYTVDTAGYDAEVILDRRCPECEHRDSVVTSALAAAVWYRRDTRILAELTMLADSMAQASLLPVVKTEGADRSGA